MVVLIILALFTAVIVATAFFVPSHARMRDRRKKNIYSWDYMNNPIVKELRRGTNLQKKD